MKTHMNNGKYYDSNGRYPEGGPSWGWIFIIAGLCLFLLMGVSPAEADVTEVVCLGVEAMHDTLVIVYGEFPIRAEGDYELWINPELGTWSELWYPTEGTACLIRSGIGDPA